jgi:GNAT superfamily N-acetyltransferase
MIPSLLPPAPLAATHRLEAFDCGEPLLNDWLQRRAWANQHTGASRTFVVSDPELRVCGYYALAAGAVAQSEASGAVRRNMPDPIPVLILARLAVDLRCQGKQLGPALLQDALHRTLNVANEVGVRALLVHALNDRAKAFYQHYGFQPSPLHPLILMLRLPGVG